MKTEQRYCITGMAVQNRPEYSEQIEMLKNKEYDKMLAKFERELKRVRESLQD